MDRDFWSSKRVFITGHTGFKGSWLILLLHSLGAKIIGYALPPATTPNLFELGQVEKYLEASIIENICNLKYLKKSILEAEPDIVFHLAAQPLVRYAYENPIETYQTNVMGTVNVLEAIRMTNSIKVFINITTDKCYENDNKLTPFSEKDPLGGADPYSSSKACAEVVTAAYRSSYFNDYNKGIATVRAGNVIGGGDWSHDRLIPDIIKAFMDEEKLVIRYPLAIRPWQHVLEPLRGYLMLAEKLWYEPKHYSESWNFGPPLSDCRPVNWIVNKISQLWGKSFDFQFDNSKNFHEAQFLALDISKARSQLQWQPLWDIHRTLESIVDWYQHWMKQEDMLTATLKQINE